MVLTCGPVTSFRAPADSRTHSPSDKAGVAVAAATFKAAALDADVVAVVAVATIRVAAVTKDAADADSTTGAKVHTTKETKAPTYYQGNTDSCNQGGGGWSNNMPCPPSVQPESQNAQSFHNLPVPGTVMVPMQMVRGTQASGNK